MGLCRELLEKLALQPFVVLIINVGVCNFEPTTTAAEQLAGGLDRYFAPAAKRSKALDEQQRSIEDRDAALENHIDELQESQSYHCEQCGLILPAFCAEPHRLFHQSNFDVE